MLQDTTNLCREFQKRYSQLHPNKSAFHNIYVCQSVDKAGNVTDTKYGMNSLTDFGLHMLFGWYAKTYTYNGNTVTITPPSSSNLVQMPFANSDGTYINFGEEPSDPAYDVDYDLGIFEFPEPWEGSQKFSVTRKTHGVDGADFDYNSNNSWHTYHDGIISATEFLLSGTFNYNITDTSGNTITEDGVLTRIGIMIKSGSYSSSPSIGKDLVMCHARIYDADGNPSSIIKKPNEKLYVTIYVSCSMDASIYDRLWNEHGASGALSLIYLLTTIKISDVNYNRLCPNIIYNRSQFEHQSAWNIMKYNGGTALSSVTSEPHVFHQTRTGMTKLFEEKTHAIFAYSITSPGHWRPYYSSWGSSYYVTMTTFQIFFMVPLELPEPEELINDDVYTASVYNPEFNENLFKGSFNTRQKVGNFNVRDFNITDISRYSYEDHDWSIPLSFVAQPDNLYDTYPFTRSFFFKVMKDDELVRCNVYFNIYRKAILSFTNTNVNSLYATDSFWDPDSWVLIRDIHDIEPELQNKRYFVLTSPYYAQPNISYSANSGNNNTQPLYPVYDNQPMKLLNSEPIYIKQLPVNGELVDITINSLLYNHTSSSLSTVHQYKIVCNDTVSHPWMLCSRSVVFFNDTLTNITHYKELPPSDVYTELPSDSNREYSQTGRYQYKNRVLIQRQYYLLSAAVYDFSDPDNIQQWEVVGSLTIGATKTSNGRHIISNQSGRYVVAFGAIFYGNFTNQIEHSWVFDIGESDEDPAIYELPEAYQAYPILNTNYIVCKVGEVSGFDFVIIDMSEYISITKNNETLSEEERIDPFENSIIRRFTLDMTGTATQPILGCFGFNNYVYINATDGNVLSTWHYDIQHSQLVRLSEMINSFKNSIRFEALWFDGINAYNDNNYFYMKYDYIDIGNSYTYSCTSNMDGNDICIVSCVTDNVCFVIRENDYANPIRLQVATITDQTRLYRQYTSIKNVNGQLLLTSIGRLPFCGRLYNGSYDYYVYEFSPHIMDLGLYLDTVSPENRNSSSDWLDRVGLSRDIPDTSSFESWCFMKDKLVAISFKNLRIEIIPINNLLPLKMTGTTKTIQTYNNPKQLTMPTFKISFSNNGINLNTNGDP